jgi:hypothetical protein
MPIGTTQKLILAFVVIIIGAVLLAAASTESNTVTTLSNTVEENLTIPRNNEADWEANSSEAVTLANAPTGWETSDCPLTNLIITNGTYATLTADTNYSANLSTGIIYFQDTAATNQSKNTNQTYANYTHCPSNYLNLPWGRTAVNTALGLFAIGILMVGVALFFGVARDYGIV